MTDSTGKTLAKFAGLLLTSAAAVTLASAAQASGSDVPAVLTGGAVFVAGRGEHIEPLPAPALHLAVAIAGRASTASVYAASDPAEHGDEGRARRVAEALRTGRALDDSDLGSALEPAARRTAVGLAERLDALRAATPTHHWHLTGSGGAAFALAADRQSAQRLAAAARGTGLPARACRTVTPTYNPGT